MKSPAKRPAIRIQREILWYLILLVSIMTVLLTIASIFVNLRFENTRLEQNLQNIAQVIASSKVVTDELAGQTEGEDSSVRPYLDSLKQSLSNIDVISVVSVEHVRVYHSNPSLMGTVYDGTLPDFSSMGTIYTTSDIGPSGPQRRAYAAIYDGNGNYLGFVLAVMLNQNINRIIFNAISVHLLCASVIIMCAIVISMRLAAKIKRLMLGFEPDIFSAMFSIRDNILESLKEGILAVDSDMRIVYMNQAAERMLDVSTPHPEGMRLTQVYPQYHLDRVLQTGEKEFNMPVRSKKQSDILSDHMPIMEHKQIVGALCILHDRTEYTKLMEDLTGVRYMVECMRANNHDFTNKLHVILGLIQMGSLDEASEYITHITTIQQTLIHNIMNSIDDPSVAALLIGKYARAAELNIHFALESGSKLSREDISIPSGDLVTIIGNLIENAMDSINSKSSPPKELTVGIFTRAHAMLISVDDTGGGIPTEDKETIFENGYSTKGENRGTGLYVVKNLVKNYGGTISLESEPGVGTSFTVTLSDRGGDDCV